jgi:hypothetical protein
LKGAIFTLSSVCGLMAASLAHATLGGGADTVETDRARFAARAAASMGANFTIQTLTSPNGGVVKEFVGPDGVVFAVSWRGPGRPDLQQLLGDRFAVMQTDNLRSGPRRKIPLTVNRADFILHSGGHPGAFWGRAYLPQALPSGFSGADFQ